MTCGNRAKVPILDGVHAAAAIRLSPRVLAAVLVAVLTLGIAAYRADDRSPDVITASIDVAPPDDVAAPADPSHAAVWTPPVTTPPESVAAPVAPPAPEAAPVPALRDPAAPLRVSFLGDSMAWTIANAVAPHAAGHHVSVANAGIWGCGVVRGTPFRYFGSLYNALPNGCDDWPGLWRASVERDRPELALIVVGRWELMDRMHAGSWTHIGVPEFDAYLASELDLAITTVAATGVRPVVATAPYFRRGSRPDGGTWPEDETHRVDRVNQLLREAVARHPGVASVVELGAKLSPAGHMTKEVDGVRVRTDGVHVAQDAGPWLAPWLFERLRAATP